MDGPRLALLVAAIIAASLAPAIAAADSFRLRDAYWASYAPGRPSTFTVVLSYEGPRPIEGLRATLDPGPASMGGAPTIRYGEEVERGQLIALTYTLTPPPSPDVTCYIAKLTIEADGLEESLRVPITLMGAPAISVSLRPSEVDRGATSNVSLIVSNMGTGAARLVQVVASSTSPYVSVAGGSAVIPVLPPLEPIEVPMRLSVDERSPRSGTLTVTIAYLDQLGRAYTYAGSVGFTVRPMPPSTLSLSLRPSSLMPDEVNEVELMLRNEGGLDLLNVTVALEPSQGLVVIGESRVLVDVVEAGGERSVPLSIYVPPGLYGASALVAHVSYVDARGRSYAYSVVLGVKVGGEARFTLLRSYYVPPAVFPGDSNVEVVAVIANVGEQPAEEVEASLITPNGITPSYAGSTEVKLGLVRPGEHRELRFYVDLDEGLSPGRCNLTLRVSYASGAEALTIPLDVSRKARFEVVEVEPRAFRRDERGVELTMLLRNLEDVEAEQVRVKLLGAIFTGSTTSFIGTVEGHSTATASFDVDVSPTAPIGDVDVEVQVIWAQRGRMLMQSVKVPIRVEGEVGVEALRALPLRYKLGLIALVAIAVLTAYIVRRSRRSTGRP